MREAMLAIPDPKNRSRKHGCSHLCPLPQLVNSHISSTSSNTNPDNHSERLVAITE